MFENKTERSKKLFKQPHSADEFKIYMKRIKIEKPAAPKSLNPPLSPAFIYPLKLSNNFFSHWDCVKWRISPTIFAQFGWKKASQLFINWFKFLLVCIFLLQILPSPAQHSHHPPLHLFLIKTRWCFLCIFGKNFNDERELPLLTIFLLFEAMDPLRKLQDVLKFVERWAKFLISASSTYYKGFLLIN